MDKPVIITYETIGNAEVLFALADQLHEYSEKYPEIQFNINIKDE